MCLAVSVTADPRLSQGYYAYTFDMGSFPDYLKIGAWLDGYYFSANGDGNALVAVFDRASMLNGGTRRGRPVHRRGRPAEQQLQRPDAVGHRRLDAAASRRTGLLLPACRR